MKGKTGAATGVNFSVNKNGLTMTNAIDPQVGFADFGLSCAVAGDGSVSVGIAGQTVSALTYNPKTPASLTISLMMRLSLWQ